MVTVSDSASLLPASHEWPGAEIRSCPEGRLLFTEGEPSAGLWIVQRGRVRLTRRDPHGRGIVTAFQGPGAALDIAAALDGHLHSITATTADASELLFVPHGLLMRMLDSDETRARVYALIGREMRQRDVLMRILFTKDAHARVHCSLLHLAQCFGIEEGNTAAIAGAVRRQDIADLTGVRLETAIRIMSELEKRHIIQTTNQEIRLLDREQLRVYNGCTTCQCDCSVFDPVVSAN